ncbi:MAG: hypothetical protein PHN31_03500, partial [Candidatus Gracilibacteria bacterium]|nr:hypothetical protein [Candidatus Gracilibacteria bacterium]
MRNKKLFFYIFIFFISLFLSLNHSFAVNIITNTTISSATTYDTLVVQSGATLTINAALTITGDALIEYGGVINHSQAGSTSSNLIVGGTLTINPGGKYDVSGKGIASTGAGAQTVGATHGGYGYGASSKAPYGDIFNPTTVGSYGRNTSYPGGGLVRMTVGNLVNNGYILANGSNISRGQGAGGSINITVNGNLSGTGIYQAKGGGISSYIGGGGRVAIRYNTVSSLATLKSKISAVGYSVAGEGTVYLKDLTTSYQILIIKGDGSDRGTSTAVNLSDIDEVILDGGGLSLIGSYPWNLTSSFSLNNGAFLTSNSTSPITVSGTLSISSGCTLSTSGTLSVDNLLLYDGGVYNSSNSINIYSDLSLSGGTINSYSSLSIHNDLNLLSGALNSYSSLSVLNNGVIKASSTLNNNSSFNVSGNLTIESGGIITHNAVAASSSNLIVGGTLTINPGGKYDVSGKGIASTGAGAQTVGATHGGYGYGSSKAPYGDIFNPTTVGSYGYNSSYPGGGLVRMTVGNLVNNGYILANGSNISRGQGAGGSINITVNGNLS